MLGNHGSLRLCVTCLQKALGWAAMADSGRWLSVATRSRLATSISPILVLLLGVPFLLFIAAKIFNFWGFAFCRFGTEGQCDYRLYVSLMWLGIASSSFMFGALGITISVVTRPQAPDRYQDHGDALSFIVLQLVGAVFGGLALLLFVGGFVQGSLFPGFGSPIRWTALNLNLDEWAKLLVWCFLAGFSERMVPDFLSNLIARFETPDSRKPQTGDDRA